MRDTKKIASRYLKSARFVTDVVSLLNLPLMSLYVSNRNIKDVALLCGLFKVIKITRLQTMNAQSKLHKDNKAIVSFTYYTLVLICYLHLTGCLLFYFYYGTYERSTDCISFLNDLGILTDIQVPADPT